MNLLTRKVNPMQHRKNELYLVTVKTPASLHESTIEAESLHRAACAGVVERGFEVDTGSWIKRPVQRINAHRLLSLESAWASIRVTAEALTY
jgi:hypothetical protein